MKKVALILTAIMFLLMSSCSKGTETVSGGSSLIAQKYAPENSVLMLSFSSLDKLYSTLSVTPDSFMGEPNPKSDRQEIIDKLGFDPADPAEFDRIGFDTKKEFGFVLSDLLIDGNELGKTSANFGFLVPVKKGADAYSFIKTKLNEIKDENTVIEENGNMLTIRTNDQPEFFGSIKSDGDYLVFNFAFNSQITAAVFFGSAKHLADSPNYKEVGKEINLASDITFYFDSQIFAARNENSLRDLSLNPVFGGNQAGQSFENIKFGRGSAFVTDLSSPDFNIKSVGFLSPGNPAAKIISSAKKDRSVILGIEKNPALIFSAVLNASEYMDFLMETFPPEAKMSFEEALNNYNAMLGVDIRKDFIDLMAGSINFGIYDGASINLMQYNTVLSFNIKDRAKMIATMDKIAPMANMQKMSPEGISGLLGDKKPTGNFDVYSINMGMAFIYVMADDENVSICTSKEISADIMDKKNTSFAEKTDKDLASKLKNDQIYLYIDFAETYAAAKTIYNFYTQMSGSPSVLDAKADAFVKNLIHFYAFGNLDGEKMTSELTLKTKFSKPFFIALQEEILKMKQ
jgi:hypothetical protein